MQINLSVSDKKKCHYTISLYSWFFVSLVLQYILVTFHGSILLNIKLGPTTTSSPRRRGRGLHKPDSSHDQIRCFWFAEVINYINIMIESDLYLVYLLGNTVTAAKLHVVKSCNGKVFHMTEPCEGKLLAKVPSQMASDTELWRSLCHSVGQAVEQTVECNDID